MVVALRPRPATVASRIRTSGGCPSRYVDPFSAPSTDRSASRYPAPTGSGERAAAWSIIARSSAADASGRTAAINAATPAACGAAIDVPDLYS